MHPLRHLPRFRAAYRELEVLASRERWSRTELEKFQVARLNELWTQAVLHVPYYRSLKASLNLPDRFRSVEEYRAHLPVLEKTTVASRRSEFFSETAGAGRWHSTSGSTGTPMRVFRTHREHQEMLRAKYRFYSLWGLDIFDRVAWLWSGHDATSSSWTAPWKDRLRNRLRLSASRLGADALQDHLRRIRKFRPAAIYSFSRAAYMLAQEAEASGFACESLKFVCMTGEAASPGMIELVRRAFDAPAIMEYGSVDCGFLAGESPDGTLRVRGDIAIVETAPREDGMFDILVTPLTGRSFPLLRYRIGDLTHAPIAHPPEGFPILPAVSGRNDDLIRTKSGRFVHSASVDELFEHHYDATISRYCVHQHADGSIVVKVVLHRSAASPQASKLARKLSNLLEGYPVDFQVVDRIPQTAAGKHRLVTSDLAPKEPQANQRSDVRDQNALWATP